MKIAVTAANGQLSRAIIKELTLQIGKGNVIGIARTPTKASDLGIELRKGDYNSYEDFLSALKGIDRVLLLSGLDDPNKRIDQHRNIIRAAEQNNVEKLVYTSIVGTPLETAFDPIIISNRRTENDIKDSKLNWAIGRNGIYIEPDLEYLESYEKAGCIWNNAGEGKCAYTSRAELAKAYTQLLLNDSLNKEVYNLTAEPITQKELTDLMNNYYGASLTYKFYTTKDYLEDRIGELGEFFGTVVTGIYEGISKGSFDVKSDFEKVMNRPHLPVSEMIKAYKDN